MRGKATLAIVVSSACMIVASITERVMMPRLLPVTGGIGVTEKSAMMFRIDLGCYAETGMQGKLAGIVDGNAHRQTLHHFYPVAGCVFGRQHGKRRTGAGADADHLAR